MLARAIAGEASLCSSWLLFITSLLQEKDEDMLHTMRWKDLRLTDVCDKSRAQFTKSLRRLMPILLIELRNTYSAHTNDCPC